MRFKLNPGQKFFILLSCYALVVAAIAGAYFLMHQRIRALVSELADRDVRIASQRKEQRQTGALLGLAQDHAADFARLKAFRVNRSNPAEFLRTFEALASRTRTNIKISLSGDTAGEDMIFQFAVEGAEKNVAAMLALIEHAPYELVIEDLSVQKVKGDGGSDNAPLITRLLVRVRVKIAA